MSEKVTHMLDHHSRKPEPIVRSASGIEPRELDPVWPGVLWAGKPTLVAGDPGLGKSLLTVDVAARVTTGDPWPCHSERREPADVVMMSAEDDAGDTIVPRLMAAGANLSRVKFVEGIREFYEDGPHVSWFSLDKHLVMLSDLLGTYQGRARLLIIDPISAYMGQADSHRNSDVRVLLAGLAVIAQEHRLAILVVSHLRKAGSGSAVYRVTGSLAFTAAARAVFAVVRDPEDEDVRLFLPVKNNLGPDSDGFTYSVRANDDNIPMVSWGDEREARTIGEIFDDENPRQAAKNERDAEVAEWLQDQLSAGPRPATEMWGAAKAAGFSDREVKRGKKTAGVKAEILGYQGAWHWRL